MGKHGKLPQTEQDLVSDGSQAARGRTETSFERLCRLSPMWDRLRAAQITNLNLNNNCYLNRLHINYNNTKGEKRAFRSEQEMANGN